MPDLRNIEQLLDEKKEELEALHKELNNKQGQSRKLQEELEHQRGQLRELCEELEDKQGKLKELATLTKELCYKQGQLHGLSEELEDKRGHLRNLHQELDDKQGKLQGLPAELERTTGELAQRDKDAELRKLHDRLEDKDAQIAILHKKVQDHQKMIEALTIKLDERSNLVEKKVADSDETKFAADSDERKVADSEKKVADSEKLVADSDEVSHHDEFQGSKSTGRSPYDAGTEKPLQASRPDRNDRVEKYGKLRKGPNGAQDVRIQAIAQLIKQLASVSMFIQKNTQQRPLVSGGPEAPRRPHNVGPPQLHPGSPGRSLWQPSQQSPKLSNDHYSDWMSDCRSMPTSRQKQKADAGFSDSTWPGMNDRFQGPLKDLSPQPTTPRNYEVNVPNHPVVSRTGKMAVTPAWEPNTSSVAGRRPTAAATSVDHQDGGLGRLQKDSSTRIIGNPDTSNEHATFSRGAVDHKRATPFHLIPSAFSKSDGRQPRTTVSGDGSGNVIPPRASLSRRPRPSVWGANAGDKLRPSGSSLSLKPSSSEWGSITEKYANPAPSNSHEPHTANGIVSGKAAEVSLEDSWQDLGAMDIGGRSMYSSTGGSHELHDMDVSTKGRNDPSSTGGVRQPGESFSALSRSSVESTAVIVDRDQSPSPGAAGWEGVGASESWSSWGAKDRREEHPETNGGPLYTPLTQAQGSQEQSFTATPTPGPLDDNKKASAIASSDPPWQIDQSPPCQSFADATNSNPHAAQRRPVTILKATHHLPLPGNQSQFTIKNPHPDSARRGSATAAQEVHHLPLVSDQRGPRSERFTMVNHPPHPDGTRQGPLADTHQLPLPGNQSQFTVKNPHPDSARRGSATAAQEVHRLPLASDQRGPRSESFTMVNHPPHPDGTRQGPLTDTHQLPLASHQFESALCESFTTAPSSHPGSSRRDMASFVREATRQPLAGNQSLLTQFTATHPQVDKTQKGSLTSLDSEEINHLPSTANKSPRNRSSFTTSTLSHPEHTRRGLVSSPREVDHPPLPDTPLIHPSTSYKPERRTSRFSFSPTLRRMPSLFNRRKSQLGLIDPFLMKMDVDATSRQHSGNYSKEWPSPGAADKLKPHHGADTTIARGEFSSEPRRAYSHQGLTGTLGKDGHDSPQTSSRHGSSHHSSPFLSIIERMQATGSAAEEESSSEKTKSQTGSTGSRQRLSRQIAADDKKAFLSRIFSKLQNAITDSRHGMHGDLDEETILFLSMQS
ncbi:hypothetical protein CBR_g57604 [Chara braunii]|uniref:Uncharacterized protein n=1 Tax=Chara braunii TaxID=69332 RepID=A0A388ME93_CHABU|nr:hypothetical protein CBR_g57604 [Chara braunii]|eukprot:GBG92877.1 hypothetical protein CBR_g57604 [Chara braunii]